MNEEQKRIQDPAWKIWGPYMSYRQWGTVREDYSPNGDAWNSTTHDMARSKAWRWGEEGIAGISDEQGVLNFAWSFWNKHDAILKERFFGLTNEEGNHGEDVKELYYHLDSSPTHSYMKMLYKYPIAAFPYDNLVEVNKNRSRNEPEFELYDTGIFNDDNYFDIIVEYAKASPTDILIKITVNNLSNNDASINIIPTVWYANNWSWFHNSYKPNITCISKNTLLLENENFGKYYLHVKEAAQVLFCENETNNRRLYNSSNDSNYAKDGINDYIIHGTKNTVNHEEGTKAGINYDVTIPAQGTVSYCLRLNQNKVNKVFDDFDGIFSLRQKETDEYYEELQQGIKNEDEKLIQRQAFAGMLWSKQVYHYNVEVWLNGDEKMPPPPPERKLGRNSGWRHINNNYVISMPDKWEYPWYATWDLAFHCINFAVIDSDFAKDQLLHFTHDWYMHPNGQLPAYEWDFSNVNPPVHAWATWRVYLMDEKIKGKPDVEFLKAVYHKLLLNFTWWVNRKDRENNNIFEGGFLGLDNIGVFDRNAVLPHGVELEQSDATSWMAMYALNMMRIALELCKFDLVYQDMASKFFEHFLNIADAMENLNGDGKGLWDYQDEFYYDRLHSKDGIDISVTLRLRSIVGIIPLFAVEVIDEESLQHAPKFIERMNWLFKNKPQLAALVSRWEEPNNTQHLLSLLRGHRMKKILERVLDTNEFLSPHGVRSISKFHLNNPYRIALDGNNFTVTYLPGESDSGIFGGNSNWRGPVWLPINFLVIESLRSFHSYYGDDFKIECPTGSGNFLTIKEIAYFLSDKIVSLFTKDENSNRAFLNDTSTMQRDPNFNDHILFHEYFNGDNGKGLGASHQTGWTGIVAKIIHLKNELDK
ncbi:glucosidase [Arachidicoccus ginsenosidimutans]|uniref:MGH1-like glycoside hydrolase domain-containing protein n=1 Tax=Arachidicoccus sp. BS20 TaxID=1850526 RepID=UPI0007F10360|nr:glucosidase [Arachidicoccus sp. BS20]ANI90322.1 glucosidase [Arachidicoccus sp. BS20]